MSWSVEFIPFVSWPVLWALAGIGLTLIVLLLWRSRRGAVLRLVSLALLLLAIANPHLKQEEREPLNDVVAVVVDVSQSQAIAGRGATLAAHGSRAPDQLLHAYRSELAGDRCRRRR